jgi:hypothetical protein
VRRPAHDSVSSVSGRAWTRLGQYPAARPHGLVHPCEYRGRRRPRRTCSSPSLRSDVGPPFQQRQQPLEPLVGGPGTGVTQASVAPRPRVALVLTAMTGRRPRSVGSGSGTMGSSWRTVPSFGPPTMTAAGQLRRGSSSLWAPRDEATRQARSATDDRDVRSILVAGHPVMPCRRSRTDLNGTGRGTQRAQ